jgi:hypothetical protein
MVQTQSGFPYGRCGYEPCVYDRGRDRVAKAFLARESFRSRGAAFTDGRSAFSYGYYYVTAQWRNDDSIGVNETFVSMTTSGHSGAIRRALQEEGWKATHETYTGENGHTYRVWRNTRG